MDKKVFFYNLGYQMAKEAKEESFSRRHPILTSTAIGAIPTLVLGGLLGRKFGKYISENTQLAKFLGTTPENIKKLLTLGGAAAFGVPGATVGLFHGIGRYQGQRESTPKGKIKKFIYDLIKD